EIGGGGKEGMRESLSSLSPPIHSSISPCVSTGKLQTEAFTRHIIAAFLSRPPAPPPLFTCKRSILMCVRLLCHRRDPSSRRLNKWRGKLCQVERLQRLRRGGEVGKMVEGTLWVERNTRMEGLTMYVKASRHTLIHKQYIRGDFICSSGVHIDFAQRFTNARVQNQLSVEDKLKGGREQLPRAVCVSECVRDVSPAPQLNKLDPDKQTVRAMM
ncbi:hypothetical protein KUCAC02_001266, partial [Chaenocephalus aceratus]